MLEEFICKLQYLLGLGGYNFLCSGNQKYSSKEFQRLLEIQLVLDYFTSGDIAIKDSQYIAQTIDFFEVRYNLNNVPYIEYPSRVTRIGNCNGCGNDANFPYHNFLLGLQGGFNYNYYHLGQNEYDAAINANNPSADNPFLTELDLVNIESIDNEVKVITINQNLLSETGTLKEQVSEYVNANIPVDYSKFFSKLNIVVETIQDTTSVASTKIFEFINKPSGIYGFGGIEIQPEDLLLIEDSTPSWEDIVDKPLSLKDITIVWEFDGDKTYNIDPIFYLNEVNHIHLERVFLLPDGIDYLEDPDEGTIVLGTLVNPEVGDKITMNLTVIEI